MAPWSPLVGRHPPLFTQQRPGLPQNPLMARHIWTLTNPLQILGSKRCYATISSRTRHYGSIAIRGNSWHANEHIFLYKVMDSTTCTGKLSERINDVEALDGVVKATLG